MNPNNLCIYCMKEKSSPEEICPFCGNKNEVWHSSAHHLPPITILKGRYLLGIVLGEGGFGITYVAIDLTVNRRVAIKELFLRGKVSRKNTRTVLVDQSESGKRYYNECKRKFLQEAMILSQLKDKTGVVDILDFFEENATAYIVMDFLEGQDLGTLLMSKGGRISCADTFRMLRPVMRSMIQVHQAGILHRDISPDNLRCLDDGRVKIMDFGSAKQVEEDTTSIIRFVKNGYAPPEQYSEGTYLGPWMDVYAMTATFYRCITGITPKGSFKRERDDDLVFPEEIVKEMPQSLMKVIQKGMALHKEDRYTDMWELYQAMKGVFLQSEPSETKQISEGALSNRTAKEPEPFSFEQAVTWIKGNFWVVPVACLWLILVIRLCISFFAR